MKFINSFRYVLDTTSRKFICPKCAERRFVRYVETSTGRYLPPKYGRCDRENTCGYLVNPDAGNVATYDHQRPIVQKPETSFIPFDTFNKTRSRYYQNSFVTFLRQVFDSKTVQRIIVNYHLGTYLYKRRKCVIFWQIDTAGRIRSGHIMLYDKCGHRKKGQNQINTWAHAVLYDKNNFHLKQCFFGEHLLIKDSRPVIVVESEKTACIGFGYLPQFSWIATCGSNNLRSKALHCHALKGQNVILLPDTDQFTTWRKTGKEFGFHTSDLLCQVATEDERKSGLDVADFLLRYNPKTIHRILAKF